MEKIRAKKIINIDEFRAMLESELPPLIFRKNSEFSKYSGISSRSAANLDSSGLGPAERVQIGRSIAYPRDAYIRWIISRVKSG